MALGSTILLVRTKPYNLNKARKGSDPQLKNPHTIAPARRLRLSHSASTNNYSTRRTRRTRMTKGERRGERRTKRWEWFSDYRKVCTAISYTISTNLQRHVFVPASALVVATTTTTAVSTTTAAAGAPSLTTNTTSTTVVTTTTTMRPGLLAPPAPHTPINIRLRPTHTYPRRRTPLQPTKPPH